MTGLEESGKACIVAILTHASLQPQWEVGATMRVLDVLKKCFVFVTDILHCSAGSVTAEARGIKRIAQMDKLDIVLEAFANHTPK